MAADKSRLYGGRKKTAASDGAGRSNERKGLFYNSWLEGYSTRTEVGPDGKKRSVSVYEGAYYTPDVSRKQWILRKTAYMALLVLAAALFLLAATAEIQGNYQKVLALLQAVDVVCVLWLFRKMISYCASGRKLTVGEYQNISKALIRTAMAAAFGFAATAAAELALLFWSVPGERGKTVLCVTLYACCGLCMWALFRLEKGLRYMECPSHANQEEETSEPSFSKEVR